MRFFATINASKSFKIPTTAVSAEISAEKEKSVKMASANALVKSVTASVSGQIEIQIIVEDAGTNVLKELIALKGYVAVSVASSVTEDA